MNNWAAVLVTAVCAYPALANCEPVRKKVKFDAAQSEAVGPVEKLTVTVTCGWVVGLRNVPEALRDPDALRLAHGERFRDAASPG